MPHDRNGNELTAGDRVLVPCTVRSISPGDDHCNVTLETEEVMRPGTDKTALCLNAGQCVKEMPPVITAPPT